MDRRTVLGASTALLATGALATGAAESAAAKARNTQSHRRIATEEAFASPEQMEAMTGICRGTWNNLDLGLWRSLTNPQSASRSRLRRALLDIEADRIRDMDEAGVHAQVLSLTAPGVQMLDADTAVAVASASNDRLADIVARHPRRFYGLAAFAPQDPKRAVLEMERSIRELKLNGFILNSHTNNQYFDDQKFWPILEAAEALDRPLYIHPRCPSDQLAEGCRDYSLSSGMWGFHSETSLHATRMILAGVFDRFPRLTVVLGHMGEGLPYWLYRIGNIYDAFHPPGAATRLQTPPVEVFKRNFVITTSGVNDPQVLQFVIAKLGVERVLWAIDYPYERSAPAVQFMDTAPVTETERAKLYHGNAERVFHIPA